MKCVFDLEGNGLLDTVHTIWCGVFTDIETGNKYKFTPDKMNEMLEFMNNCETLIGHNVINFDFPVLKKVLNYEYKGKVVDTLVLSFLSYPDRYGGHSVGNWAKLLKRDVQKVEHEDWSVFTPEMLHRCSVDVDIQVDIYNALIADLKPVKAFSIDWTEAISLEHAIAKIITDQEHNGAPFNLVLAKEYLKYLEVLIGEIKENVLGLLGYYYKKGTQVNQIFKADGSYRSHILKWFDGNLSEDGSYSIGGAYSKVELDRISLSMYGRVKTRLVKFGWKPTKFTDKGAPKMPTTEELEEIARLIDNPELNLYATYGSVSNRLNIIKKWVKTAESSGNSTLPAGAFPNGTNTGRFKHTTVVNVPRATTKDGELIYAPDKQGSFFGTEMRSLFWNNGDDDYRVVGADAAGLELRCLAHYLNNKHFTDTVLDGDVHTLFWDAAGGKPWISSRNDMKSVTYAWLYGAGDLKIASLCTAKKGDVQISWGRTVRKNLLAGVGGLKQLVDTVISASERGYLRGLDGRKIFMRKSNGKVQTHKALNTLLQSTGSILVKKWTQLVNERAKKAGLDARQVIHMHDEMQWLCHKDDVEVLSSILKDCMVEAGEYFNFNIPLAADVAVGQNWAETH